MNENNQKIKQAPFETFAEHAHRAESNEPYNDAFIKRCRDKYVEYLTEDKIIRPSLLHDLYIVVPYHFRNRVFF